MTDNISTLDAKRTSIAAGSLVEMKTGGPAMVVETRTAEKAYCVWHNNEGDVLRDWIPLIALRAKR